jgi:hypothetical protein
MLVITDMNQLQPYEAQAEKDLIDKLKSIDYSHFFVIGVFRGMQPSSGYGVVIRRVFQRGTQVIVQAQFLVPGPYPSVQIGTALSHIIKIQKTTGIDSRTEFILDTQVVVPTP